MKAKSVFLKEMEKEAPIKFARADLAGAERYFDKEGSNFDLSKAAEIYVRNAAKRMFEKSPEKLEPDELKKIVSGLGATFRAGAKEPVSQETAKSFKAAIKKELGKFGYTAAKKKTKKVEKKVEKGDEDLNKAMAGEKKKKVELIKKIKEDSNPKKNNYEYHHTSDEDKKKFVVDVGDIKGFDDKEKFEEFMEMCKAHNIKVKVIKGPKDKETKDSETISFTKEEILQRSNFLSSLEK